jgi:hypothetical protein
MRNFADFSNFEESPLFHSQHVGIARSGVRIWFDISNGVRN